MFAFSLQLRKTAEFAYVFYMLWASTLRTLEMESKAVSEEVDQGKHSLKQHLFISKEFMKNARCLGLKPTELRTI